MISETIAKYSSQNKYLCFSRMVRSTNKCDDDGPRPAYRHKVQTCPLSRMESSLHDTLQLSTDVMENLHALSLPITTLKDSR